MTSPAARNRKPLTPASCVRRLFQCCLLAGLALICFDSPGTGTAPLPQLSPHLPTHADFLLAAGMIPALVDNLARLLHRHQRGHQHFSHLQNLH